MQFQLFSDYEPAGDQPQAIEQLTDGLTSGLAHQTLLGVTGSGKTYSIANVIQRVQRLKIFRLIGAQVYFALRWLFHAAPMSGSWSARFPMQSQL